jgi:purine-nucleoside phosphorylase
MMNKTNINRLPTYLELDKYNITAENVVQLTLHCSPEVIQEKVIMMPTWKPEVFAGIADNIKEISSGIWQIEYRKHLLSLIITGMGAPMVGEAALALGCTQCDTIIFCGSAAALCADFKIGDFFIPEKSICGDGFSRYLEPEVVPKDCLFQPVEPDLSLTEHIWETGTKHCQGESITLHRGTVFTIDSVLTEFYRINYFASQLKCTGLEMETSAVFKAAKIIGIKTAALLEISDIPEKNKSFFSGRSQEEKDHYRYGKYKVLPRIILNSLVGL